jgi:hypothetical protein
MLGALFSKWPDAVCGAPQYSGVGAGDQLGDDGAGFRIPNWASKARIRASNSPTVTLARLQRLAQVDKFALPITPRRLDREQWLSFFLWPTGRLPDARNCTTCRTGASCCCAKFFEQARDGDRVVPACRLVSQGVVTSS